MSIVHLPRPIRFWSVILIALLALGVRAPAGAHAAPQANGGSWAAIAYSPSTGHWATAWNYPSQESAKGGALYQCFKKASDCRSMVSVRNGYAALAVSSNGAAAGRWGNTLYEAKLRAKSGCNDNGGVHCYIKTTVSSSD
ncbi:MAG TPA: DUF4189 domain-containing protein [Roseiflexaceae bacterium]|nr:DUF4189 domain-containing protein [Roseiflexaceae bacterium]